MTSLTLAGLPVVRDGGRWHLRIGFGRVPLDDAALVRDLDQLCVLLGPGGPTEPKKEGL
ncbi:hypothetical protein [Streptacidiphilus sp. MAP5-52]|uniref:hypothetical protein n=1 Tax=Streptacidiphilus sp. MAP5-52 TaxID=3156267 RepID=UPI003515DD97